MQCSSRDQHDYEMECNRHGDFYLTVVRAIFCYRRTRKMDFPKSYTITAWKAFFEKLEVAIKPHIGTDYGTAEQSRVERALYARGTGKGNVTNKVIVRVYKCIIIISIEGEESSWTSF